MVFSGFLGGFFEPRRPMTGSFITPFLVTYFFCVCFCAGLGFLSPFFVVFLFTADGCFFSLSRLFFRAFFSFNGLVNFL